MQIKDLTLLQTDSNAFLKQLKEKSSHFFDRGKYDLYEPEGHSVLDPKVRKKRWVEYQEPINPADPVDTETRTVKKEVDVVRIALNLQKLIVTRAVAFLTGGGVTLTVADTDPTAERLLQAVKKIWQESKLDFENGTVATVVKSQKECAELWYFDKEKKPRFKVHQPKDGFIFYPVWDEEGDLIAFGVGWHVSGAEYSEVMRLWTPTRIYGYEYANGMWREAVNQMNLLGKIPLVYHYQEKADWEDVQPLIDRIEEALSDLGDTNVKTADPLLKIIGEVQGYRDKGKSGAVQLENGADVGYVTAPNTPDSVKMELEYLYRNLWAGSQTADISAEAMRGLGPISGAALERIFLDAYLKASQDHAGVFGKSIQRRVNILKAIAIAQDPTLKPARDVAIVPVFNRFSLSSEEDRIALAQKANGGEPVVDGVKGVEMAGVATDPQAMWAAIQKQQKQSAAPTNARIGFQNVGDASDS